MTFPFFLVSVCVCVCGGRFCIYMFVHTCVRQSGVAILPEGQCERREDSLAARICGKWFSAVPMSAVLGLGGRSVLMRWLG